MLSRIWVRTADAEYNFEIHDLTETCASQSRDSNTSLCMFELQGANISFGDRRSARRTTTLLVALFQHVDYLYFGIRWSWAHFNFCLQNPQISYSALKPLIMVEQKLNAALRNATVGDNASAGFGGNYSADVLSYQSYHARLLSA